MAHTTSITLSGTMHRTIPHVSVLYSISVWRFVGNIFFALGAVQRCPSIAVIIIPSSFTENVQIVENETGRHFDGSRYSREALFFVLWGGSLFCGRIFCGTVKIVKATNGGQHEM